MGELIVQTNADLQRIENEYGARGRAWRRTVRATDGTIETQSTFTFDTAANGLGRLAAETITGTYAGWQGQSGVAHAFSRSHAYDAFGRPLSTTTVIDGVSYPGAVAYDALGRANRVQDATGQWSKTAYDARGFVRAICPSGGASDNSPTCGSSWITVEESDAWGNVIREIRSASGQLPVTRTYSPLTGRLERICADRPGTGGACDLVDEQYAWDQAGNLHTRAKDTRYIETFQYDTLNRLTHGHASVGGGANQLTHYAQYDRLGNTCARLSEAIQSTVALGYSGRAGCGTGSLDGGGTGSDIGAHQVNQVHTGPLAGTYHYDNRGNQVLRDVAGTAKDRRIRYSADDRPYEISLGSEGAPSQRARFWYGSDGQRYKREDLGGKRTLYLGNVEVVIQGAQTTMRRMIGGSLLQLVVNGVNDNRFLFHDQLGSLVKITDPLGNVVDALDYMPNGTRRNTANPQLPVEHSPALTPRGFTGHEHVDGFDVIHMNGRIYDPTLGRFLQPDPVVQAPMGAQGWNAYTYVFNNPLAYTDPTGMIGVAIYFKHQMAKQIGRSVIRAIGPEAAGAIAGIGCAFAGPWAPLCNAAANYEITRAMGGSSSEGLRSGAIAAFSSYVGGQIGTGSYSQAFGQAVLGGVMSELQGGKFGHGFMSAGLTAMVMPEIGAKFSGRPERIVAGAIAGGTISVMTGGKFANGAMSGAVQAALMSGSVAEDNATYSEPDADSVGNNVIINEALKSGITYDGDGGMSIEVPYDVGLGVIPEFESRFVSTVQESLTASFEKRGMAVRVSVSLVRDPSRAVFIFEACGPSNYCARQSTMGAYNYGSRVLYIRPGAPRSSYVHEFLHMVGLRHQWNRTNSIMSYQLNTRRIRYQDMRRVYDAYR